MKILVVDDHAMFAESLRVLLGSMHQISTAATGTDALAQITANGPSGILLDQNLPDIDGITLLKVIQALPCPPPVLLLSGNRDMNMISQARKHGAVGFLHKSMSAETLIHALEKMARGEAVWPDNGSGSDTQLDSQETEQTAAIKADMFNKQVVKGLGITDRQLQVLRLLIMGEPNKSIASQMGIAESTVKTHVKTLFSLLRVSNRIACYNRALELGVISS